MVKLFMLIVYIFRGLNPVSRSATIRLILLRSSFSRCFNWIFPRWFAFCETNSFWSAVKLTEFNKTDNRKICRFSFLHKKKYANIYLLILFVLFPVNLMNYFFWIVVKKIIYYMKAYHHTSFLTINEMQRVCKKLNIQTK